MYRALYRKWRPRDFDDVVGQNRITDILKYEVGEKKTSHAYLFCGSRGTGKTTCAKILAKAVNCENPQNGNPCNTCAACLSIDAGTAPDVIEMDAASNTGVDNVRDIKDEIIYTPAELRYRVYIIDEVHMMSGSAFNALLKTLEEPPAHVLFILATTELHKLPSTIVSRCQRLDFRRLASADIVAHLLKIAAAESIDLEEDGARVIARMALGGMRDAISLLELCAGVQKRLDAACVVEILGMGNRHTVERLVRAVLARDYAAIYETVADEVMSSRDLLVFFRDILEFYRDLLVTRTSPSAAEYLDLTDVEMRSLAELAEAIPMATLLYHTRLLEDALSDMQRADAPRRAIVELTLTRMCEPKLCDTVESLLARLEAVESELTRLRAGSSLPAAEQTPAPMAEEAPPAPARTAVPTPAPKKKTAAAPARPAQSATPAFRTFSAWREVIDRVAAQHPGTQGFLDGTKAYRREDGGEYLLSVSGRFALNMLSRPDTLASLKMAIAEEVGCTAGDVNLRLAVAGEEKTDSPIYEIEQALGQL